MVMVCHDEILVFVKYQLGFILLLVFLMLMFCHDCSFGGDFIGTGSHRRDADGKMSAKRNVCRRSMK